MNKEKLEDIITVTLSLLENNKIEEAKQLLKNANDDINSDYNFKYGRYKYKPINKDN